MLMETRDSLLLIVPFPVVRVSSGSFVVSGGLDLQLRLAEGDVEIHAMNHVFCPRAVDLFQVILELAPWSPFLMSIR